MECIIFTRNTFTLRCFTINLYSYVCCILSMNFQFMKHTHKIFSIFVSSRRIFILHSRCTRSRKVLPNRTRFRLIQRDRVGRIIIFIKISNPRTFECASGCVFQRGINVSSGSRLTHKRVNSVLMGSRKSTESTSSSGASHRIYDA